MKIKDVKKHYEKLKVLLTQKRFTAKIGLFEDSGTNDGVSIVEYAAKNEFGTDKIPARPFLATTFDQNVQNYQTKVKDLLNKSFNGKHAIEAIAEIASDDVKRQISSNMPPPNAQSTIDRKKSSQTLIDTGAMRSAVTYKIVI